MQGRPVRGCGAYLVNTRTQTVVRTDLDCAAFDFAEAKRRGVLC
ncbi:hypothetical protein [Skermania sp. ID1734]|nr:hypothetical protein [Skermania sp. ID1734]